MSDSDISKGKGVPPRAVSRRPRVRSTKTYGLTHKAMLSYRAGTAAPPRVKLIIKKASPQKTEVVARDSKTDAIWTPKDEIILCRISDAADVASTEWQDLSDLSDADFIKAMSR